MNVNYYGFKEVKNKIITFLVVRKVMGSNIMVQFFYFVGLLALGKLFLVKSITRVLNCKFICISLNIELRIRLRFINIIILTRGMFPGRIIQKMR